MPPRDPARVPRILETIRTFWRRNPDMRLCQIIANIGIMEKAAGEQDTEDVFFIEDDVLEERIKGMIRDSEPKPIDSEV